MRDMSALCSVLAPFSPALTNGDLPFNLIAREALEFSAEAEIHHRDVPQVQAGERSRTLQAAEKNKRVGGLLFLVGLMMTPGFRMDALMSAIPFL